MKQTAKFVLTLLAGVALGAGAIGALQAQGVKKPAYVIADVAVTDPAGFQAYATKVPETLKPYNARIVVRGKPEIQRRGGSSGEYRDCCFRQSGRCREVVQHAALQRVDPGAPEGGKIAALYR